MDTAQINAAIIAGNFNNDELTSVIDAVKFARARLGDNNKRAMRIGATVSFINSRSGLKMTGTVRKIAIKNVVVDTPQGGWKVPANMLTVEA